MSFGFDLLTNGGMHMNFEAFCQFSLIFAVFLPSSDVHELAFYAVNNGKMI